MTTAALGELCDVRIGRTPRRDSPQFWNGDFPWATISELDGSFITRTKEGITQLAIETVMPPPVPAGTLLFSFKLSIGKMAIAGVPLHTNEAIAALVIRDSGELDRDYLRYALMATSTGDGANHAVLGKVLNKAKVEALQIPLPSLEEQRRLVDLLSRAEGIVRLRREAQRKAAELVPALFLDMFGDPASNPKGWPVVSFAEMADTQLGKMLDKKKQTGLHSSPYLGNSNVRWDDFDLDDLLEMDFSEQERVKFQLMSGDLLACEGGEVGRAAIWRGQMEGCFYQKAIHRIRPKPSLAVPEFILHWLWIMSKQGRLANAGAKATIAHLPAEKLRSLKVALPPVDLQRQFAVKVEAVRGIAAQQTAALATAQATFEALLHQSFQH